MPGVLHVGFYNYVTADSVVALIDYKLIAAKKIIKLAKEEKPRSVMDLTKGRKAQTLVVITGDRYIISAIPRVQLAKRLTTVPSDIPENLITLSSNLDNLGALFHAPSSELESETHQESSSD